MTRLEVRLDDHNFYFYLFCQFSELCALGGVIILYGYKKQKKSHG